VLVLVVVVLSIGPDTLLEAGRGLTFARPPTTVQPEPVPHPDADLQRRVDVAATGLSRGTVAAQVVALDSGAIAGIAADREFPAASLFKLPILVEVLAQERFGRLDPSTLLEIREEDWADGSGVLQARVGDRLSVRELQRLMIEQSDNIAALVLLDAVGAANVNATASQLGLHGTRVVDRRAGEPGEHVTTAGDIAHLLSSAGSGQLVDDWVSEQLLSLLELKQAKTWLGGNLPWWVKVAHKWGELPDVRNDAGVIYSPRGAYVAVVLTQDAPPDEAQRVIARIARAGYDHLGAPARSSAER
jgi:beta-lactamase class A